MQINRLFEIIYLLLEKGSVTAAALAERFEVSVRTIYRDIDLLSGAGIPVYCSRGRGGGVSLLPDFVLDKSLLSEREQDEILFALQSVAATHARRLYISHLVSIFNHLKKNLQIFIWKFFFFHTLKCRTLKC